MSSYETIRYEVSGGIARLTLDRPDQRNGMTKRMVRETHAPLTEAAAAPWRPRVPVGYLPPGPSG